MGLIIAAVPKILFLTIAKVNRLSTLYFLLHSFLCLQHDSLVHSSLKLTKLSLYIQHLPDNNTAGRDFLHEIFIHSLQWKQKGRDPWGALINPTYFYLQHRIYLYIPMELFIQSPCISLYSNLCQTSLLNNSSVNPATHFK